MSDYITIQSNENYELIEKKSKFIANTYYIESKEKAEEIIKENKKRFYDARHNCFAYRVLSDQGIIEKSSDDGEPSGTAGAPMLNILSKNNIVNVLVIVTRYFGGILLGTGGLVKAYSESTQNALEKSKFAKIIRGIELEIEIEYSEFEQVKYYCRKKDIKIKDVQYLENIFCNIEMKKENLEQFLEEITKKSLKIATYKILQEINILESE